MAMSLDHEEIVPVPKAFADLARSEMPSAEDLRKEVEERLRVMAKEAGADPDGPVFRVGEVVEVQGARFTVEAIGPKLLALRPAGKEES